MKLALVTTTINVPTVLKAYRSMVSRSSGPEVRIFVALDQKSPFKELAHWGYDTAFSWLTPDFQNKWKSSEAIGWNTDSRRNIAVLEALKWGANTIVSIDDDMIPSGDNFFIHIAKTLTHPFSGVCLGTESQWLDVGTLTTPLARQRGLPSNAGGPTTHEFVNNVQIGAMQGIILGTPDTDAATTIVNRPFVHSASDVLKAGFVVDPNTKAVYNSQITAFRRELAPAFAQFYKWQGRNTDIIASVIMRRLMRDRNLYTYYGPPTGYHARAPREPQKDMNAEQWGLNKIERLQDYLDNTSVIVPGQSCIEQLRAIYRDMLMFDMFPKDNIECALAWLDDCETVL